ncbi:MAG TPA: SPOR domain-containing protein [Candidatus Krumholzibacteria bacterium]|nr:SPOR domain-containing protein [Candidatus Krumholzibacteria bacterium]
MQVHMRMTLAAAALVAGSLVAAGGCGGGNQQDAPPATALVPGAQATADTLAAPDSTSLAAGTMAEPAVTATLNAAPSRATAETVGAPRGTDVARKPAPGGTWALQIGSFRSLDNARRLVERANALGYRPVLESVVIGGETHHRVVLRGLPDRAEAASVGERLRSELGITYLIRQSD